jgi:steroid 5-alpha reductase family enzyme
MSEGMTSEWIAEMWQGMYPIIAGFCTMGYVWYFVSGIECIIDFFWIFNHLVVGTVFIWKSYNAGLGGLHPTYFLQYLLLWFWFARLGGFLLFSRVLTGHEDKRYVMLRKRLPNHMGLYFFFNYQLQAVLLVFTSSTLYWSFYKRSVDPASMSLLEMLTWAVGMGLATKGLVMEAIADNELEAWKANFSKNGAFKLTDAGADAVANKDIKAKYHRSCIDGMWAKCRHPNLFHELEFWFGLGIVGLGDMSSWTRIASLFGPLMLYFIMAKLTIPLTERTMKPTREDYWVEYTQKYPKLLPTSWP